MINLIVCMDKTRGIGLNNSMPWHLPKDLAYFKETTDGHIVVMGRNTFESIGRPLPNRVNIVISRTMDDERDDIIVVPSIQMALNKIEEIAEGTEMETFVIGGGQIYKPFFDLADRLYVTKIDAKFTTDTKFPYIHEEDWEEFVNVEDVDGVYKLNFIIYIKKE